MALDHLTLDFSDKTVSYDVFIRDVAGAVVRLLAEVRNDPDIVSQRQAYAIFGRGNVDRWRRLGKIEPLSKRPGKIEYRTSELRVLQSVQQDYLECDLDK